MKKFIVFLTVILIVGTNNIAVNAEETSSVEQQVQAFVLPNGEISEEVYVNDYFYKRIAQIDDKSYTIIVDYEKDLYIIDNRVFTIKQLNHFIANDPLIKDSYNYMLNNMHSYENEYNYDKANEIIESTINRDPCSMLRCSRCGLNPNIPPRTGYKSKPYIVYDYYDEPIPVVLSLSAMAIDKLAKILKVSPTVAKFIIVYNYIARGFDLTVLTAHRFYVNKTLYQYEHTRCPNAVKEVAVPFILDINGRKSISYPNKSVTTYFYRGR